MSFQDCVITSVVGTNGQPLPLQGNSLGPTTKTVKKERHDEAEIQELAIKMMEQQKAALLKQQQQTQAAQMAAAARNPGLLNPAAAANGQQYINNYFQRNAAAAAAAGVVPPSRNGQHTNGSSNTSSTAANATTASPGPEKPKPNDDEESQKGHFGWTTFGGKVHIPYILRQQEKYCAVRMTETKLLVKYLGCLHPEIYSSCTCVRSYYITEAESRLLNEINHKHCDAQFGRDMFTHKDLVVRLSDATKFYQFLDICYRKLISGSKTPSEKCGFIRINKESVVPYTVRNGEQVVPLFYFEGETENLRQKADNLSGWDLAYLKFCCKVQGIRNELFSSESVAVISLTDIKSYFPNGTEFEDYWPSKVVDSNLLLSPQRHNSNNAINWTRQPSAPPPSKMMHQPQAAKQQQQQPNQQSNGNANRYNQQMQQNPVRNLQTAMTLEQLGQQFALGFMQPHMMAQAQVQQGKNNPLSRSHMVHMMNAIRENPRSFSNPIPNYSNGVVHYPNQQIPPPLVKQGNQSQNAMLNFTRHEQQQKRSLASNDPSPSTYKHSVNVNNPTNYPLSPMSSSSSTSSTPDLTSLSLWLNNQTAQKELLGQMAKTLQQQHHQQQQQKHLQQQMSRDIKPSIPSLIPMNNTNIGSLQQNNSKFNMTKEMQDVVKKVLSNPDLSTFVQTNSSSNFVPFISPPVSPADSLTITPASPKPKSSYHHNNYHTNNNSRNSSNNNSYNNKMADQMLRQKSVICSTSNVPSPATKQTLLQSHAKYRSPMEVIDLSNSSPTPSRLNSHYQQQMAQAAAQRLQLQSGVSVHSVGGGGGSGRSGMSNGSQSGGGGNNVGNNQNSATMHLQRHAANLQQAAANGYGDQRLNVIPEVQNTMHAPPYKVQKVFVDNTTVPCINMKAYQDTDQLIALTDLREFLFPKASLDICKRSIEAIHVEMYKGNRKQVQILMENNRIPNEHVPLVQVRDILKFMPQLRYMIQNQMDQQQQQPLQKRARIS